jgi:hypothetical protein
MHNNLTNTVGSHIYNTTGAKYPTWVCNWKRLYFLQLHAQPQQKVAK